MGLLSDETVLFDFARLFQRMSAGDGQVSFDQRREETKGSVNGWLAEKGELEGRTRKREAGVFVRRPVVVVS